MTHCTSEITFHDGSIAQPVGKNHDKMGHNTTKEVKFEG